MNLYPNTRIELIEEWLCNIKILSDKINQKLTDKCEIEENEGKRINKFIERCALEFDLFEEIYYSCRINAINNGEHDDDLMLDDLDILKDYLVSYRITLLEGEKDHEFNILFDLAKHEAERVANINVVNELIVLESENNLQNRESKFTKIISKLDTPVGTFILDRINSFFSSIIEGAARGST